MSDLAIPLVDLHIQHDRVDSEVREGFARVLETAAFVLGPEVERFELQYANYCGVRHCVGVGNGTDAIELALRALDIGPGDEVITAANTFVATAEAITRTGATLVLADCDENFLIDPAAVAAAVTTRTKAVVPVHLYGQMAPMAELSRLGTGIHLVEDAAQSQGASQNGRKSGAVGVVNATSFYPGKNLGAYGDAGAVTAEDDAIAGKLRALRNHGGVGKYQHGILGVNSRLDGLQAVVLSAKLSRLDGWNDERRTAAARYTQMLADEEKIRTPATVVGNLHAWHLYVVRVPGRDGIATRLNTIGIQAGIHYPHPIHHLAPFANLGYGRGSFPVAERLAAEVLSLPLYPGITEAQQDRVVAELRAAL